METRYIVEFISLAKTLSYSRSAKELHLSQSSLTRHIQMMEKELGPLFVRTTRKIELSNQGKIYLPYAVKIAEAEQKAEAAVKHYTKDNSTTFRVGIARHADLYFVTDCMVQFHHEHPEIQLEMIEENLSGLQNDFDNGRLNVVTMAFSDDNYPKQGFIKAGVIDLIAIIPKHHFLASYDYIPLHRLNGLPLILPESGSIFNVRVCDIFERDGIVPEIVYQGSTVSGLRMLKEGMGIMIDTKPVAETINDDNLVIRSLMPNISFTFGLEYSEKLSNSEYQFVKFIQRLFKK